MRRPIAAAAAAAVLGLALVSFVGCYTVLKHPRQVSMTDEQGSRRSCSDCHDQAFYYHDPFMYRYYDHYGYSDRWYGYYYDPWWYDDYWYYDAWDGESVPIQRDGRTRWGAEPPRPGASERGTTTNVGTSGPTVTSPTGKTDSGSGASAAEPPAQTVTDKDSRTRWGDQPARPKPPPPEKTDSTKKAGETKKTEPKKAKDSDD